ncbi:MarR family winged helix-turn-helix transcriptional regulator [Tomitella biformata]|uniref:MarR family winged helix-turn-helix transcriptional regulator n=1 Tax=Tomitella biformata TaxID=630403 RepID=UPI00046502CA|nr:MarR family winged helix-turn-helix transcriptional regulator [Tomitella biformata]
MESQELIPRRPGDGRDDERDVSSLEYELILLSRHSLQRGRLQEMDRSAYILLGRLELADAMSLKELAVACRVDVSTINRQVGMLERKSLVERVKDPDGGVARKVRPTRLGLERLRADREISCDGVRKVVRDWPDERVGQLRQLLREFNGGIEHLEGQRWPRPGDS